MTDLNDDDLVAITRMVLTQQGQQPIYQVDITAQRVLSGKTLQFNALIRVTDDVRPALKRLHVATGGTPVSIADYNEILELLRRERVGET